MAELTQKILDHDLQIQSTLDEADSVAQKVMQEADIYAEHLMEEQQRGFEKRKEHEVAILS